MKSHYVLKIELPPFFLLLPLPFLSFPSTQKLNSHIFLLWIVMGSNFDFFSNDLWFQSDYLRKISLKMLTMESKSSQSNIPNSLASNPSGNNNRPPDTAGNVFGWALISAIGFAQFLLQLLYVLVCRRFTYTC